MSSHRSTRPIRDLGITVVELILVVALLGALSAYAVPALLQELIRMKEDRAVLDIRLIEGQINRFHDENDRFPNSLDELEPPPPQDPWGNSYQYLHSGDKGWKGKFRKDRFLVPLNSDFDLYSSGPDGESRPPLAAPVSHDDIIRANNGGYVGAAAGF